MYPFLLNGEFIADALKVLLKNNSIVVYHADGSINTYSYIDAPTAQAYYNGVKASQTATTGIIISSIIPTTFDVTAATVTIMGANFPSGDTLVLHIEDTAGGFDDNGFFMNCTWKDSGTLIAVPGGNGDSVWTSQMYVYLRDTTISQRSTVLMATWPGSGTTITMQQ